ncbi:hypothetical protein EDC91_1428 [Shewanella fodinae]|uniref:Uncharacterized protein n=1 Tax=Shewanella fodinae TaxID=552357 RepID=A0A4R2FDK1_9GAMM|nr:hypothetical protein EDC91_1428 [Shewanella fodinae]
MNALRSRRHSSEHAAQYRRLDKVTNKVVTKKAPSCSSSQQPVVSKEELAYIFSLFC